MRNNQDLDEFINVEDIVRIIKSQSLAWLGHVKRVPKEKNVLENIGWRNVWNKKIWETKKKMD